MERTEQSANAVETLKSFTDVLFITNRDEMPTPTRRLFEEQELSYVFVSPDDFDRIDSRLELIGAAVVHIGDIDASQYSRLSSIVELLESEQIDIVALDDPTQTAISMKGGLESIPLSDLIPRIRTSLTNRDKSDDASKAAEPSHKHQSTRKNTMAEQLHITEAFVDNLAEQLRLAGLVQQDFLPGQLPNTESLTWAAVFQPAEWVAGDIYDAVRIDETHIGFYIADVVGHGMPAALLTIFLKQALVMRQTVDNSYHIFSPADVMKNLNLRMTAQKLSGYQFATCCYCLLNTETLEMTYCRAGHPYPILIRPGEEPEQLQARGSLLGVFANAEFIEKTVQLQPGDKLFLYSDGADSFVGDYEDESGFHFSERFAELSKKPIAEMMDDLTGFAQNQDIDSPEFDDITGLGLEIV